jgi:hypothetical protein
LKEIQENNEKISEANKYLAKINKVQAQAARQGENAKAVIPADVILFFKKNGLTMPSDFFGNDAEIATYENSNFSKRMTYLDDGSKGISNVLSYLAQGHLKAGEKISNNLMLADLSNRDLLELGSLKEIYEQTDYADKKFDDVSKKVKAKDPVAGFLSALTYLAIAYLTIITAGAALLLVGIAVGVTESLGVGLTSPIYGTAAKFHATEQLVAGTDNNLLEAYWFNRTKVKEDDPSAQIKSVLNNYTGALIANMDEDLPPFPCSFEGIAGNKSGVYNVGCSEAATNGFQLSGWAPASMGWGGTGHYQYLANKMGETSGGSSKDFESGSNQRMVEAFDMLSHQKYYGQDKGVFKENYTEPDYDYNALILMYKLEALADCYGNDVAQIAVDYLSGRKNTAQTIDFLNKQMSPERASQGAVVYTSDDVKMMKAYIDGKNLFTDDEDFPECEKKTLTQCWLENDSIKAVLNKLYGDGSRGLNADEVSLWSENMRMYIDKINTNGQTLSTKMQRMMQRCNETTSLASQMLKSVGDICKQLTGNIR